MQLMQSTTLSCHALESLAGDLGDRSDGDSSSQILRKVLYNPDHSRGDGSDANAG